MIPSWRHLHYSLTTLIEMNHFIQTYLFRFFFSACNSSCHLFIQALVRLLSEVQVIESVMLQFSLFPDVYVLVFADPLKKSQVAWAVFVGDLEVQQ